MHWEYKTVKAPASGGFMGGKVNQAAFESKLNEHGQQQWELVSAFVTHRGYGSSREIIAIFKREKR
jgi:hypothetical protein